MVSPDALALVRFGLHAANDPRILNTVRVIDALLKVDLPPGPSWHHYNADGYGEHEDGRQFDGIGIGRAWPLLTGERAHHELALGNKPGATALLAALEGFARDHLIPEQVWDAADIHEHELFRRRPSGSAMPLAWAHAEHVKLLRSLADGCVSDMPPQPRERYQIQGVHIWRFNAVACRQGAFSGLSFCRQHRFTGAATGGEPPGIRRQRIAALASTSRTSILQVSSQATRSFSRSIGLPKAAGRASTMTSLSSDVAS